MAIKLVSRDGLRGEPIDRLEREARTVSLIGHRNIVQVLDFGRIENGAYLAMELLDGETLAQRLARSGPLPVDEAASILIEVAFALEAAHAHGIVHRDLKPENVFLCRDGARTNMVKVLDFGLALAMPKTAGAASLAGTPAYVAPELLRTDGPGPTPRSDVYALGVLFVLMVSGRLPHEDQDLPSLLAAIEGTQPRLPGELAPHLAIPAEADRLAADALDRNLAHRIASAGEMRLRLVELRKLMARPVRRREDRPYPAAQRALATWVSHRASRVVVELAGTINEQSRFEDLLFSQDEDSLELRLSGVTHINSRGYSLWRDWLEQLRDDGRSVVIAECPPLLVLLFNIDSDFFAGFSVESLLMPFFCSDCEVRGVSKLRTGPLLAGDPVEVVCTRCRRRAVPDMVEGPYLRRFQGGPPTESGVRT